MTLLAALGVSSALAGFLPFGLAGVIATVLSEQIADMGRRLQEELFRAWGGSPTTTALFITGSTNLPKTTSRRQAVEEATKSSLPTEHDEQIDAPSAMQRYELALERVRANLREDGSNKILADVNASYGFRRNSLAVRSLGRAGSVLGTIVAVILWLTAATSDPTAFLVAGIIDASLVSFWWGLVSKEWVHKDAVRYADQFYITLLKT